MSVIGRWSAAQLLAAISSALAADDMPAAVELLHMLAVVSPRDAELIVNAVEIAGMVTSGDIPHRGRNNS